MQITYNQSEIETIITTHILDTLPGVNPEDINNVSLNEDGTVSIVIGEDNHSEDTPPVEAGQPRKRRQRKNPAEAKHVPVAAKEELTGTQTSTGGQSMSSTPEPEAQSEPEVATGTEAIKEEVTAEAEEAASEEAQLEAAVDEKVQEEVQQEAVADKPANKPSLFAGLKR